MNSSETRMLQYEIHRLKRQHEHARDTGNQAAAEELWAKIDEFARRLEAAGQSTVLGEYNAFGPETRGG